jgi:hypothetical protein
MIGGGGGARVCKPGLHWLSCAVVLTYGKSARGNVKVIAIQPHAMKTLWTVEVIPPYIFLNLATAGGEWSAARSGCFTPGDRALGTHRVGCLVDPRTGWGKLVVGWKEYFCHCRESNPGRLSGIHSLYWLIRCDSRQIMRVGWPSEAWN